MSSLRRPPTIKIASVPCQHSPGCTMHGCLTAAMLRQECSWETRSKESSQGRRKQTGLRGEGGREIPPTTTSTTSQREQVQLCAATKYVRLTGALEDEVSVWRATAAKRHIDSIWIREGAVVACCCFLAHAGRVKLHKAAAEEGAAGNRMPRSGIGRRFFSFFTNIY